jgi:hypothetical protein
MYIRPAYMSNMDNVFFTSVQRCSSRTVAVANGSSRLPLHGIKRHLIERTTWTGGKHTAIRIFGAVFLS